MHKTIHNITYAGGQVHIRARLDALEILSLLMRCGGCSASWMADSHMLSYIQHRAEFDSLRKYHNKEGNVMFGMPKPRPRLFRVNTVIGNTGAIARRLTKWEIRFAEITTREDVYMGCYIYLTAKLTDRQQHILTQEGADVMEMQLPAQALEDLF